MLNLSGLLLVEKLVRLGLRPTVLFDFVTLRDRSCQGWDLMNSSAGECCSILSSLVQSSSHTHLLLEVTLSILLLGRLSLKDSVLVMVMELIMMMMMVVR